MNRPFLTSLTRISPLPSATWEVRPVSYDNWSTGDYVECEAEPRDFDQLELTSGRMVSVAAGDRFVGALGEREATLEAVGSWRGVNDDGRMHVLTSAGLVGKLTSSAPLMGEPMRATYRGHVFVDGRKLRMRDCVEVGEPRSFTTPTILLIGTSMSSGKTTAGRTIVRRLKRTGRSVLAAKLAGAGRYRDILAMADAGADHIYDFVDAGMPSTVAPHDAYAEALQDLLTLMASSEADVAVVEIGASPLAAYNGVAGIDAVRSSVRLTALAAGDFYGVLGMRKMLDLPIDLVCGPAVNTTAGIDLIREHCGLPALNLAGTEDVTVLDRMLEEALA